jgi:hypothetical protein
MPVVQQRLQQQVAATAAATSAFLAKACQQQVRH